MSQLAPEIKVGDSFFRNFQGSDTSSSPLLVAIIGCMFEFMGHKDDGALLFRITEVTNYAECLSAEEADAIRHARIEVGKPPNHFPIKPGSTIWISPESFDALFPLIFYKVS